MKTGTNQLFEQASIWQSTDTGIALATVIETWGSSPRAIGSHLLVAEDGRFLGSVSGGCIESAVIEEAQASIDDGQPRLLEFGVSDELAWEVGLSCGGNIRVFVERLSTDALAMRRQTETSRDGPVALVSRLSDADWNCVTPDTLSGSLELSQSQVATVREHLAAGSSAILDNDYFVRTYSPPLRIIVIGAVHIAQTLVPVATEAGFEVILIDPRRGFATEERFPDAEICFEWPTKALQRFAPDARTAVVTLTHDPKLDDPALCAALQSPAFYIGSLGSRRTHAKRVERLEEQGLAAQTDRIHAPIGLDLGGRSTAEIAIAILAQIIQVHHQGSSI